MTEPRKMDQKNTKQRIISGIVLAVLLFSTEIIGGIAWLLFTACIAFGGLYEFYKLYDLQKSAEGIVGYVTTAGFFALLYFNYKRFLIPLFVAAFLLLMILHVLKFRKRKAEQAMASFFGLIYPVILSSFLYLTRNLEHGVYLTLIIFAGSWVSDVFAWLFGSLFGKHHLPTPISPKKTWEGVVGGILGAVLIGLGYGLVISTFSDLPYPWLICPILAASVAVFSVFGDLAASAFKRHHGIKDYSNLIPGHGGVLDRFDSVLFVAPIVYYECLLVLKLLRILNL